MARWVEDRQDAGQPVPVTDALTRKAVQACWQHSATDLLIGDRHGSQLKDFAGLYLEEPELNSRH